MANHVVCRADRLMSAKYGNFVSTVYGSDIDNGNFIALAGLSDTANNQELFSATPCAAVTDTLLLVYTPEFQGALYTPGKTLKDFYNPANKPFTAYYMNEGDIITITDVGITGTTVLNQYAYPTVGATILTAGASIPANTKLAFQVIQKLDATTAFSYSGSTYVKDTASVLLCVKK